MIFAIVICALTVALIIFSVVKFPTVKLFGKEIDCYWLIALSGAILLLLTKRISLNTLVKGLTESRAINPVKVLVLFISMTLISVFLDEAGFFKALAGFALNKSGTSQIRLFTSLYVIVSILTVFTSNDIIILTFTPFIFYFCKNANINAKPYLFGEFVSANTFSMSLIIGNPTNIYLSQSFGIGFFDYIKVMWLPSLVAGITAYVILFLLFRKQLKSPIQNAVVQSSPLNKPKTAIGLTALICCTVLLAIGNYVHIEMWLISLSFALLLFLTVFVYNLIKKCGQKDLTDTLKRTPYQLVPFVISMFTLVLCLKGYGVTDKITAILNQKGSLFYYGYSSFLSANIINNIPMSVLFSGLCVDQVGTYATVIGSNIGAYFTPIGALAGIMWTGMLKNFDYKISFAEFIKTGITVSVPVMTVSLLSLLITL